MRIKERVYYEIINCVPSVPPESGGILGAENDIICRYVFDTGIRQGKTYYWPDVALLNKIIKEWQREGIKLAGFFHTHMPEWQELSQADKSYATEILLAMPKCERSMLFPIVIPKERMVNYRVTMEDEGIIVFLEDMILVK